MTQTRSESNSATESMHSSANTPNLSNSGPLYHPMLQIQTHINPQASSQMTQNSITSPSMIKIIDLRNSQIRKLVMQSLNEIIEERKRNKIKHNQNYDQIVQSTPQTLRVINSIDDQEAVLVERVNNIDQYNESRNNEFQANNNGRSSRPPSRIANENQGQASNNGILRMSPRSQAKLFQSLEKIYLEQDSQKLRQDFEEESMSPEYTIVQALDDSCVLFAVKENQENQGRSNNSDSEVNSGQDSKFQSPNVNRNFHDPEERKLNDPEVINQLTNKLRGIQNQENMPNFKRNEARLNQEMGGGLMVESYSLDKQFLMIHPQNYKKLTPTLKAPQISRQPSIKNIDYFDLSEPYHAEVLFQRLQGLSNMEGNRDSSSHGSSHSPIEERKSESNEKEQPVQKSTDKKTTLYLSYQDPNEDSGTNSKIKTPLPSRGAPSRGDNHQIDIDLLIKKLLEIPNEELLDSLLTLSIQDQENTNTQQVQNSFQKGRDSDQNSDFNSSGIQTPGSHSFSTPIQAKLFQEKGVFGNGGKPNKGLDLRSPQTKFNLMRKLQEVKELHSSSDEDEIQRDRIAADQQEEIMRINTEYNRNVQQQFNGSSSRGVVELRAVNDFSRLFINEEDQEDSDNEEYTSVVEKEQTQPISLISPQRSLNSTMNNLQLRNLNSNQPSIELLIQKLKRLEQKRMSMNNHGSGMSESQSCQSSEAESPQKVDNIIGEPIGSGNNQVTGNVNPNQNNNSASNILEQVIKRLEKLKRSRDSSQ